MIKLYLIKVDLATVQSDISTLSYLILNELAILELGLLNGTALKINKSKKPYFEDFEKLKFNISHSESLIAIALSDKEIGIYIEKKRPINFNIKNRFTSEEKEYIKEDLNNFFEVWTKKEAFFKYKGDGIKKGFSSFNILNPVLSGLISTFSFEDYTVSVCSEEKISENDFIFLEK